MIHTDEVVIATEGSRRFDGHLARPTNGAGPGLLIFSEMWGVAASKTEMAEDYAKRGWCAYVPNMFWRSEFTGVVPFEEGRVLASLIPGARFVPLEGRDHILLPGEPATRQFFNELRAFLSAAEGQPAERIDHQQPDR